MRKLTCLFPELMAAGHRTAMFFPNPNPNPNLYSQPCRFFLHWGGIPFYLVQYGSQLGQPCKSAKVFFSYFIDFLLNLCAVNLFVGIFTQIKSLNSQRRFSAI